MKYLCRILPLFIILAQHYIQVATNPCVRSCAELDDGDYQWCDSCESFVTCFGGNSIVQQCPPTLVWNNEIQRCAESPSPTCNECTTTCSPVGSQCTVSDGTVFCECLSGYAGDGRTCTETFSSCLDRRNRDNTAPSGLYTIYNEDGEPYRVYCDFYPTHLYEYIGPADIAFLDINSHYNNPSAVVMRYALANGTQFQGNLEQIRKYRTTPISVQYNSNIRYTDIQNRAMGPYLYVGFLPIGGVNHELDVQGYSFNGRDFTFVNCNGNPYTYFALLFNSANVEFTPFSEEDTQFETLMGFYRGPKNRYNQTAMKWFGSATEVANENALPVELFSKFEIRMGGCGGYITSDQLPEVVGMTIGVRYDMYVTSCKNVYDLRGPDGAVSGEYYLTNTQGEKFKVYCEFNADHIYTFLAPMNLRTLDMDTLFNNKEQFALRYRLRATGRQYQSSIRQILRYQDMRISFQYNRAVGYGSLRNRNLYPFIYIGFIPEFGIDHFGDLQGYNVNGKDVTFTNCDGIPNSYFALLYNTDGATPQPTMKNFNPKFATESLMTRWIYRGKKVAQENFLPANFFSSFEMQLGGCGGYLNLHHDQFISGVTLGLRYDLPATTPAFSSRRSNPITSPLLTPVPVLTTATSTALLPLPPLPPSSIIPGLPTLPALPLIPFIPAGFPPLPPLPFGR